MAPTTRPKPQFSQQQMVEMAVTRMMALLGPFGMAARRVRPFLMAGAVAKALPSTSTRAICMEKPSRLQAPLPQWTTMSMGPWAVAGMAATNTMMVRMMQKMNASGSRRFTRLTQPLVIFLNIVFPSFLFNDLDRADKRNSSLSDRLFSVAPYLLNLLYPPPSVNINQVVLDKS